MGALAVVGEAGMSGGGGGWIGWQVWSVFVNDPKVHNEKKEPAVQL